MTDAIPTFSLWRRLRHTRLRDALCGRLDSSLDWRQSIERAELPAEIAGVIQQIVRRTRLWRQEKVDVTAELIAHFQDGLDAGRSPADLFESFGDARAAAQLIRRAKRRGRPLLWHAWRFGWMSAAALLLVYLAAGLWMAAGRPSITTDYLAVINKSAAAVPADQRAWPLYRDALLDIGVSLIPQSSLNLPVYEAIGKAEDESPKDLEKLLTEHAGSIAKLREAAKRPSLGFVAANSYVNFTEKDRALFRVKLEPEQIEAAKHETLKNRWLMSTLVPHLALLRSSALLLSWDARRAASAGDGNTALTDVTAMFAVSRHCEEIPFLICMLVGEAIQQRALATIRETMSQHPALWNDGQLRDLAHQMAASKIDWERGMEGERIGFYDSLQRVYTDDGHGDGRLALQVTKDQNLFQLLNSVTTNATHSESMLANPGIALLTLPAANIAVAGRKEMTDVYERLQGRALARLNAPYWTWAGGPSLDEEMKSLKTGLVGRFRYLFVLLMTPSYDRFLNRVAASEGNRDGVYIGLALELYHRQHGKWPASLDEMSPQMLPKVPIDPINGKPLHYKIVNDRPLVYSVGVDGDEDGARLAKNKEGETRPEYAEPNHFDPGTVTPPETNGDWVLWTTAS
jgi:hypothetical protein